MLKTKEEIIKENCNNWFEEGRQEQKKEDIEEEIELLEYLIDDKISTEPLPAWVKYAVEERLEKLKQGLQEKN